MSELKKATNALQIAEEHKKLLGGLADQLSIKIESETDELERCKLSLELFNTENHIESKGVYIESLIKDMANKKAMRASKLESHKKKKNILLKVIEDVKSKMTAQEKTITKANINIIKSITMPPDAIISAYDKLVEIATKYKNVPR